MTPQELAKRFITTDYRGMADQKACAVELLEQVQRGECSLEQAITAIREVRHGN
jgi:hypothetical protein